MEILIHCFGMNSVCVCVCVCVCVLCARVCARAHTHAFLCPAPSNVVSVCEQPVGARTSSPG
jgi:hypothetical protein